jgi:alpha-L-arabinofuranosidase
MLFCLVFLLSSASGLEIGLTVQLDGHQKPMSPELFGIFFEDISYAADGGLYAEMVQNRSFDYSPLDNPGWHAFTGWDLVQSGGAKASYFIGDARPVHPNNPHYLELDCDAGGLEAGAGIRNSGFDGMSLKAGENYIFSVFARQQPGKTFSLETRLENNDGTLLGRGEIPALTQDWKKYSVVINAGKDDDNARLVLLAHGDKGVIYLDMVSLFPEKTFHRRPNGLRADLAQALADLSPKFMRFPGGCLVHGDGLTNMYRWKDTIGPVEQRKSQKNIWRYHQTMGLGYFEYFQFCEDIGAVPVPVVAAGVSCQNSDRYWGVGQQAIPMEQMQEYTDEICDLIEWATGSDSSEWGAKRAAAGHPEPFGLKYLAIGNEDAQTPAFQKRFKSIYEAVKARYPKITLIGNVGPAPDGDEFERGWAFARELGLAMVAEHYYKEPEWFLKHRHRYDGYDRGGSKVFVSEYAAHDTGRRTTLRSALAEAAYMTSLERNSDIVQMACYAPLFGKIGQTRWNPNLIYFTNNQVVLTVNYYVQQLFSTHAGDLYLETAMDQADDRPAVSAVRNSKTGDVILKLVNTGPEILRLHIAFSGAKNFGGNADLIVLRGDPLAVNELQTKQPLKPRTSVIEVGSNFSYEAPAFSLSVIRIRE